MFFHLVQAGWKFLLVHDTLTWGYDMPVRKVSGGYQWGQTGKVYPTREQAERQGRAIEASGYRTKEDGKTKKAH